VFAHLLERACRLQLLAEQLSAKYHSSNAQDVAGKRDYIYADLSIRSYWDYCVGQATRVWPELTAWS
jgi:L-fuculose-phosphate aldolase